MLNVLPGNATFAKLNLLLLNASALDPLNLTLEFFARYLVKFLISGLKSVTCESLGLSTDITLDVCIPQYNEVLTFSCEVFEPVAASKDCPRYV